MKKKLFPYRARHVPDGVPCSAAAVHPDQCTGISQSVVMGANTLLLSNFVNELIASVGKGRFEAALIAATAFYVCGIIGYQLLNTLFNYALTEFLEICDETYRYEFNEKISKLFPLAFEQSESLDEIQKAQAGRDDAMFSCSI